jgi:spermidine synthase
MFRDAPRVLVILFVAGILFYTIAFAAGICFSIVTDGSLPGISLDYAQSIKDQLTREAYDQAIPQAEMALALEHASEHIAQHVMGAALARQGKTDEAIDHFRQAIAFQPRYSDAHFGLAMALAQRGADAASKESHPQAVADLGEALGHFQRTLELQPSHPLAQENLKKAIPLYAAALVAEGRDLSRVGRHETARDKYLEAIRVSPNLAQAYNNLAEILATHPDPKLRNGLQAVGYAQKARQLTGGKNPWALETLAAAYAEAGRFGEAVKTAQLAINIAQSDGESELAQRIAQYELPRYRQGKPFHRAPGSSPGAP